MTAHNLHLNSSARGLIAAYANTPPPSAVRELTAAFGTFREQHAEELRSAHAAIDELVGQVAALRIGGSGRPGDDPDIARANASVAGFMRTGRLPQGAMTSDADPDGGYTVDRVLSDTIQQRRLDISPVGRLARRVTITTGDAFEELWDTGDIGASWVGERETRPETSTTTLNKLKWPVHELYSLQPVTQRLLDDSGFDIAEWMQEKITEKSGRAEGVAFVSGDGINKPRGILAYDTEPTADSARAWGVIQYVPTGDASGFINSTTSASPLDCLVETMYALRSPYRTNARWLMNSNTASIVRKWKDPEGRFVWADGREGMPATLLGYSVEIDEEMQAIGANAFPIAFGDLKQGYLVVEKPGIRMLRDPYSSKPNVLFYAYRRVGGGLQNSEAVKLVKCAAT